MDFGAMVRAVDYAPTARLHNARPFPKYGDPRIDFPLPFITWGIGIFGSS